VGWGWGFGALPLPLLCPPVLRSGPTASSMCGGLPPPHPGPPSPGRPRPGPLQTPPPQDHRWWWRSFLCGGSTAFFVYGYCFYYYFYRSGMSGLMQTSFFFLYMGMVGGGQAGGMGNDARPHIPPGARGISPSQASGVGLKPDPPGIPPPPRRATPFSSCWEPLDGARPFGLCGPSLRASTWTEPGLGAS
jgi:hypothetical protein